MAPVTNIDRLLKARGETQEPAREAAATLTIVFADVIGASDYFERFESQPGGLPHQHAALATRIFQAQRGRVLKTVGDSVMAEFSDAVSAARATIQLQQELVEFNGALPPANRLQLRIGIHYGEGFRRGGDVFGEAVDLAALITRHTGPAQILVSQSVNSALSTETGLRSRWFRNLPYRGGKVHWIFTSSCGLRRAATLRFATSSLLR